MIEIYARTMTIGQIRRAIDDQKAFYLEWKVRGIMSENEYNEALVILESAFSFIAANSQEPEEE